MSRQRLAYWGFGSLLIFALLFGLGVLYAPDGTARAQEPPVELSGHSFFNGELIESDYVFSSEERNQCEAKATLIQLDDEAYELRVGEICGFGPRLSIWELTIDEDGNVGGVMQAEVIHPAQETGSVMGELWLRTGCMMVGEFPGLSGNWDGEQLRVSTIFEGRCHGGTMWGDPEIMGFLSGDDDPDGPMADGLDWSDGPARMDFGLDLVIAE